MSGATLGLKSSGRQASAISIPKELCEVLGGKRVINKVTICLRSVCHSIFETYFI